MILCSCLSFFFFFNDTATTEIYTLSLHDALPIFGLHSGAPVKLALLPAPANAGISFVRTDLPGKRSEEHTSELQSQSNLVCRLLLEKKKKKTRNVTRCVMSYAGSPTFSTSASYAT